MPYYMFKCENNHKMERYKETPYKRARRYRCPECGLWMYRDYRGEHSSNKTIFIDKNNDPISHQSSKRSFNGAWIEHLTPEPVFVRDKREYQELLKRTHSREKES